MKVIEHLKNSIRATANYNPEVEVKPHCIIWTDKAKQWESILPRLKVEMEELLSLGDYMPSERTGPAIWLRAAMAGNVRDYNLPYGRVPIIYLPGVSRQDLRAIEQCPQELKPLAELQYRGVIWSQVNHRDWSTLAYMITKKDGLGLSIAQDDATIEAIQRSLVKILDETVENLKKHHLDKSFFNAMMLGNDVVKDILLWIGEPEKFKANKTREEWQAFIEICQSKYNFHPEHDGVFAATEKIAWQEQAWEVIWDRFCEAPAKYEAIPDVLRKSVIPIGGNVGRFPQWNEEQERILRQDLLKLEGTTDQNAREEIIKLEEQHKERRNSVWAELGEAPIANSLKWLSDIAQKTSNYIKGNFHEIAQEQDSRGWMVDYAVLMSLAAVKKQEDIKAVIAAIRAMYLPWADANARHLQNYIKEQDYPEYSPPSSKDGECVCFIDGLRFDLAKILSEKIKVLGLNVTEKIYWAPLPTVTSTCKPALTPVADRLTGDQFQNQDFSPIVKDGGQVANSQKIINLMANEGWDILSDGYVQKDSNYGWYEFGRIDEEGHNIGWRVALQVENYLNEVIERVEGLLKAGWSEVRIVSDHGWVMIPDGLPKVPIAKSLTDSKWGRCAAIKQGALYDGAYYPWHWNKNVHFALADGVGCYRNGIEYTHGGVSLQESLMLQLVIKGKQDSSFKANVTVTDVAWKGMRCKIAVEGYHNGFKADIRLKPALAESSIVMGIKKFNEDGIASVVIDDDSNEGKDAYIVILNDHDLVVYQTTTVVGGEE